MPKRVKVDGYTGVYYRMADRIGGKGQEKIYYVTYKKDGRVIEAKAGRQYKDNMTPAKASLYRSNLIEGREQTGQEKRKAEQAIKAAEAGKWTINKLWDDYCETNPEKKSLDHDKHKFDLHLRDSIGVKEPAQFIPLDVDRIRLRLQKQGKRTQAARVLEILRRTVNYGVKRGLIAPLPFKIEVPRLNNQTTEDLNQDQLKALIKALDVDEDQTAANVMRLALFTGMRRGEIFKLQWSDIDFERGFITLQDPKGGWNQTIPLNDSARGIFGNIQRKKGNPFVFSGKFKGTHLTNCRKSFKRIRKVAQLPNDFRTLHGLRHVYASILASSGKVDLYTLQRLLTHKSPVMTQRYAHLRDEALKKASNLAGDLVASITAEKEPKKNSVDT
jgi:integrase